MVIMAGAPRVVVAGVAGVVVVGAVVAAEVVAWVVVAWVVVAGAVIARGVAVTLAPATAVAEGAAAMGSGAWASSGGGLDCTSVACNGTKHCLMWEEGGEMAFCAEKFAFRLHVACSH